MEAEICSLSPPDWPIFSVEEICKRVTSGGTPSRSRPDFYMNGSWPWVKTQELQDSWIYHTEEQITDEAVANSSAKVLPANTILLAMYGATVGQLGLLRTQMTCNQACCAIIVNPEKANFRYLYYQLRHSREQLKNLATGAAQQNLSGALIRSLRYPFPHLKAQEVIAEVFGNMDDKIELNRRMNEKLEAIAQALFKSWFINTTQTKLQQGWHEGKVSDLLTVSRNGINPGEFPDEIFDHYSMPAFDESKRPKHEAGKKIKSNKFIVSTNCVMISKLNPRIPRVWLPDLRGQNRAVCSTEFIVTIPRSGVSREFLSCLFKDDSFIRVLATMVTGTSSSHQRVKPESLLDMEVAIPPHGLIQEFTDAITPLLARINKNIAESSTLSTLRDALLPKLLSGELKYDANNATDPER